MDRIVSEFGDRVRLVVRDFPLSQHANAHKAAEVARPHVSRGKYWEYVSVLSLISLRLALTGSAVRE